MMSLFYTTSFHHKHEIAKIENIETELILAKQNKNNYNN